MAEENGEKTSELKDLVFAFGAASAIRFVLHALSDRRDSLR
jgi:hypothetical protein